MKVRYRNVWRKSGITWDLYGDYKHLAHAVAMSSVYDRTTGVRTYRPENIEGNHEWNAQSGIEVPLDSAKNWNVEFRGAYNFLHSRDLNSDAAHPTALPSVVRNHTWAGSAELSNWGEKWGGSLYISADWRRAYSDRPGFTPISLRSYSAGFHAYFPLLWKMRCYSDLRIQRQEGFADASLNRTTFQSNLIVRKSFLKDRLTFSLHVEDLFNSRRWDYATVDAQGRTERYARLFLPRYIMLYVSYKLRVAPTKKK